MNSSSFVRGAALGAAAWLAYGAVETAVVAVAPRLLSGDLAFRMLHHATTLEVLLIYALAGAAAGGIAGALSGPGASSGRLRASGLAALGITFGAHILWQFAARPSALPLALGTLGLVLGALWGVAGTTESAARRLAFATHPLAAALALVLPPWIAKDLLGSSGNAVRGGAALGLVLAVLGASALLHRRGEDDSGAAAARRFPGRALVGAVGAAAVIAAVSLAMNRVPGPTARGTAGANPTHVFLLVLDTVRADHLPVYGYAHDTAPRLTEFAAGATRYTRPVASGDMTLSTHASLFTGLSARAHGAHHPDPQGESGTGPPGRLAEDFLTMAERLAEHGYRTLGVVANHGYLSPFFRLDQGFQYWDSRPAVEWSSAKYFLRFGISRYLLAGHPRAPWEGHRAFRSADEITREGTALLDRIGDDEAFLFLNYMDAHYPYLPPLPFADLVPGRDPAMDPAVLERRRRDVMLRGATLTPEEHAHLVSQYDGGIAYVDSRIGMFLDELHRRGLYDSSLIIVTSDHGEAFGEHGLIDHGVSAYEDQVFVPLLIKYPGQTEAEVVSETVSSVDLLPTVLDVLGIETATVFPGRSLRGAGARPDPVVAEHYPFEVLVKNDPRHGDVERAVYDGNYKYLRRDGDAELYELDSDPGEGRNRAPTNAARRDLMATRLDNWLERTVATQRASGDVDSDVRERLEALGYVQ